MRPMNFDFDAQVTAALFDNTGAVFALGDGSVRFEDRTRVEAHDGAVLCACVHPSGDGIVTGGDDGKVVWSRHDEDPVVLATAQNQWIDAIDASPASGLIAFSSGRTLSVIDPKEVSFRRDFQHERTVSGVAFEPKGRRIATSTYGGAALWYARPTGPSSSRRCRTIRCTAGASRTPRICAWAAIRARCGRWPSWPMVS